MPENSTQTEPYLSLTEKMFLEIIEEKAADMVPFLQDAENVFKFLESMRNGEDPHWPPQWLFDRAFKSGNNGEDESEDTARQNDEDESEDTAPENDDH